MNKRKYLRLLNCHLLNKRIRFRRFKRKKDDIKFRFETEGSYLKEYYMKYEDAVLAIELNKGNLICNKKSEFMVFQLLEYTLCIVSL